MSEYRNNRKTLLEKCGTTPTKSRKPCLGLLLQTRGFRHLATTLEPAQWNSRVLTPRISAGYVTQSAPHEALKSIACGKLTFDQRVVLHRVETLPSPVPESHGGGRRVQGSGVGVWNPGLKVAGNSGDLALNVWQLTRGSTVPARPSHRVARGNQSSGSGVWG
jgi:hypothetical protein